MVEVGMRFKAVALGLVLAVTALTSAAVTLGRARGSAWIGQPLELVVPVQLDAGQAHDDLCADVDVFHGDSRQDSSRVQIQVTAADQPDTLLVKIVSSALIDEPVVSVYLRAGCAQKTARKYVLLADFPNDAAASSSRLAAPVALAVPTVAAAAQAASAATPPGGLAPAASKPQKAPAPVAKASKPAPPVSHAPKTVNVGKPHLRLDPVDTLAERVKLMEAITTASTLQDDLERDNLHTQTLQKDIRRLLDQAVKNEASLVALRERLERAEAERVPVAVVYVLAALVLLTLAALAFVWSKRPRQPEEHHLDSLTDTVSSADTTPTESQVDVDLAVFDESYFDKVVGKPATDPSLPR